MSVLDVSVRPDGGGMGVNRQYFERVVRVSVLDVSVRPGGGVMGVNRQYFERVVRVSDRGFAVMIVRGVDCILRE